MPWTAKRVQAYLVAAFQELPEHPIYSPGPAVLEPVLAGQPKHLDLIAATGLYLPHGSVDRRWLLTWARARATGAPSFIACCREFGWARATAYRHLDRIAATVAAGLNRDGMTRAMTNLQGAPDATKS